MGGTESRWKSTLTDEVHRQTSRLRVGPEPRLLRGEVLPGEGYVYTSNQTDSNVTVTVERDDWQHRAHVVGPHSPGTGQAVTGADCPNGARARATRSRGY
jgi:hypothetical protein